VASPPLLQKIVLLASLIAILKLLFYDDVNLLYPLGTALIMSAASFTLKMFSILLLRSLSL